jgi:hypothetical protein
MIVHYSTPAEEDLAYWTLHSKKITQRIESLIEDVRQHPFSGIGRPEPLCFQWSGYGRAGSIKNIVSYTRFMRIACTLFNAGIIIEAFIKSGYPSRPVGGTSGPESIHHRRHGLFRLLAAGELCLANDKLNLNAEALVLTRNYEADSTGFCGHVFSGAYELENGLGSGSGKSFEDI